jgi:hypothetical protein
MELLTELERTVESTASATTQSARKYDKGGLFPVIAFICRHLSPFAITTTTGAPKEPGRFEGRHPLRGASPTLF